MPNREQEKGRTDMEQRLPFRKTKIADFLKGNCLPLKNRLYGQSVKLARPG